MKRCNGGVNARPVDGVAARGVQRLQRQRGDGADFVGGRVQRVKEATGIHAGDAARCRRRGAALGVARERAAAGGAAGAEERVARRGREATGGLHLLESVWRGVGANSGQELQVATVPRSLDGGPHGEERERRLALRRVYRRRA